YAAVVACQRASVVTVLAVEIEPQNRAAHANVLRDANELLIRHAELPWPERHDLHEANSARGGNSPTVEVAFDLDHGHHETGRQLEAPRLARPVMQNLLPLVRIRHSLDELWLHRRAPDLLGEFVLETFPSLGRLAQQPAQLWVLVLIGTSRQADCQQQAEETRERATS